jgi:hypothetical protein
MQLNAPVEASDRICDIIDRAVTKVGELWEGHKFLHEDYNKMLEESPKTADLVKKLSDEIDDVREERECIALCQKYVNAHNHMFKRRAAIKESEMTASISK